MTLVDLFQFYLGDAETIRRLAGNPWTLAVGGILVLSAGLARHYDTHDLLRQSWRLFVPFVASTIAASILFLVIVLLRGPGSADGALGMGILATFWLTAPIAWLYGLPFERIWAAAQAARARRITLAIVAVARVTLMTQCVGALLNYPWWANLLIVLGFAVPTGILAVAAAMLFLRRPEASTTRPATGDLAVVNSAQHVIDAMGVVPENLPNHDPVMRPLDVALLPRGNSSAGLALGCLSVILLVAGSWVLARFIPGQPILEPLAVATVPPSPAVWVAASLGVMLWVPLLLLRQPAHRRRTMFVSRLRYGLLEGTMRDLASYSPADFPVYWCPAAALARVDFASRLLAATPIAADLPAGNWVRVCFLEEFKRMIPVWLDSLDLWLDKNDRMPEERLRELTLLRDFLRQLPEAKELLQPYHDYLSELCIYTRERDPPRFEILEDLLALALRRGSQR